jgi:hypothetical protein
MEEPYWLFAVVLINWLLASPLLSLARKDTGSIPATQREERLKERQ